LEDLGKAAWLVFALASELLRCTRARKLISPSSPIHQLLVRIFSTTILSFKAIQKGKLVDCSSLSLLAERCGRETFTRIEIPLEVYMCVYTRIRSPHRF
jgi:hypothetical protein